MHEKSQDDAFIFWNKDVVCSTLLGNTHFDVLTDLLLQKGWCFEPKNASSGL
jgi:hypothetical protein